MNLSFLPSWFHWQTMAKIQRHQQEALWEFVHTELTYINKLKIINDVRIPQQFLLFTVLLKCTFVLQHDERKSWGGTFMSNKAVSVFHSWLLQLLSTCTSVDFCWRSVCKQHSHKWTGKKTKHRSAANTYNMQAYFPLLCVSLTWTDWHPLKLKQNTAQMSKWNMYHSDIFPLRSWKIKQTKGVKL